MCWRQRENGVEMEALNRGFYTKGIFGKQKMRGTLNLAGLGQQGEGRYLRSRISRVRQEETTIGLAAEVMHQRGGRSEQRDGLSPG
jgi:hypothetical protein